jgi:predicted alpha-1,2-mannosidase
MAGADGKPTSVERQPVDPVTIDDPARYVNPFVGTKEGGIDFGHGGGAANTFPGATTPFGMVQFSPDTAVHQHGGYQYDDDHLKGFSLTHLSGPGCDDLGNLPFLPVLDGEHGGTVAFAHEHEEASPGYYRVDLANGVRVELSATTRSGIARITYPAGRRGGLVLDAARAVNAATGEITAAGGALSGHTDSGGFCGQGNRYRLFFHAGADGGFTADRERGSKLHLDFAGRPQVTVRFGLSYVDAEGAARNLAAEQGERGFDEIRDAARQEWNGLLGRIAVAGGDDDRRTVFYTALYHSLIHPNVFSDVGGDYRGFDGAVHRVADGHAQYANFSGWDVYRSQVQLVALLVPDTAADIAQSAANQAAHAGYWDRWTVANDGTGVMVGDPLHIVVSAIHAFGGTGFDAAGALRLMLAGTTDDRERPGHAHYDAAGYLPEPTEGVWGSVSTALEYYAADFAVAQFAARLGDAATHERFQWRAQGWRHLAHPGSGYVQPRRPDTSWPEFAPTQTEGFVEGNAAQYAFSVPFNNRGLFDAMGGDAAVLPRLEEFFTELNAGPDKPYAYLGNEPTLHAPWLFAYAGAPHRTQDIVRHAVSRLYRPTPDGLVGNDDLGQLSSWAVWAMLGMYPVAPGRAELVLASPAFERATVRRGNGVTIEVAAPGASVARRYVHALAVDGVAWSRPWLPESFVAAGGTLEYELSETADPSWGAAPEDAPPSFDHVGTPAPLGAHARVRGISDDAHPGAGDLDLVGFSYSAQALAAAGLTPGGTLSVDGLTYTWPAAGVPDNVIAFGQVLDLSGAAEGAARLGFLGAATHGPAGGTVLLRYADGYEQRAVVGFSDWTLSAGRAEREYGNVVAARMPYRNGRHGRDTVTTHVFATAPIPLETDRRLVSATLPWGVPHGRLHLFAVATG